MLETPILLIIFNRPETTAKVFEAIRQIRPARLYVAADAPRPGHPSDKERSQQAREIVLHPDWPCELKTLFRDTNLGCSLGPRTAFDWFFSMEEEGIILEDDCVPDPSFFLFCREMLEKYRHEERIISVNGSNLGYKLENGDSYTFSRFMNMWGWATWRRSAVRIDYTLEDWKKEKRPLRTLYSWMRQDLADMDINWYKYWKNKFDLTVTREEITWWDWQWIYHQLKNRQLSIVPARNLVTNIGFHADATHTLEGENPAAFLPAASLGFPLHHPVKMRPDLRYEEDFVKWVWCYHRRLPRSFYAKQLIRKLITR